MRRKTARIMLTTIPANTRMSNNLGSLGIRYAPHYIGVGSSMIPDELSRVGKQLTVYISLKF